ncbi:MAG: putative transcriptional regulator [Hyphomicrobiales bacterium]|nr:putative transcriptional regulator [Hyphomicrobiales bacterium]
MTREQIESAAARDPDSSPLTPADFARMKRTPQVKIIRRALGLSQDDFAARYHIPIGTLRDWEQGRAVPDQAARAYLTVIARDPEMVRKALDARLENDPRFLRRVENARKSLRAGRGVRLENVKP